MPVARCTSGQGTGPRALGVLAYIRSSSAVPLALAVAVAAAVTRNMCNQHIAIVIGQLALAVVQGVCESAGGGGSRPRLSSPVPSFFHGHVRCLHSYARGLHVLDLQLLLPLPILEK